MLTKCHIQPSEGCLSIVILSYQYNNSQYKEKTVWRPSYLYTGNSPTYKGLYIEIGPRYFQLLMSYSVHILERARKHRECCPPGAETGTNRAIQWLLKPWLLVLPCHQQPWYWLCRINLSYTYVSWNKFSMTKLNIFSLMDHYLQITKP